MGITLQRVNLEHEYLLDMITNNGFVIKKEDKFMPTNVDQMINSSKFMDCEYRCDCGAFIGQDLVGQKCPRCGSEISLHSLNFQYTGWIDLGEHHVISPVYHAIVKRVLGNNMLRFILGDYKADHSVQYNENDVDFEENKKNKKTGRVSQNDIAFISKKIPQNKHQYMGLGHDEFYRRFEEVMAACAPKSNPELQILLDNKSAVFTSKIPIYSTAFRPVSKTSETMFYPRINKWFSMICSIYCKLDDMVLDIEKIQALNYIQNYLIAASDFLIANEIKGKDGFVRSEIVGGPFSFSGRGVITYDNTLEIDALDLPYSMVVTAYQYKIAHTLCTRYNMTLEQAYLYVNSNERNPYVISILDEIIAEKQWVIILREPTNNLASIDLSYIRRYKFDDDTISITTEPLKGLNADFDGDALNLVFLPKEIVPEFESFHYSCLTDRVTGKVDVSLREWNGACLGIMSE
jgi:hypothetical protein